MDARKRVALVTGGTRGIGAAIVRRLAADGFSVVFSGRTQSSVDAALERFAREGIGVAGHPADARKEADQASLSEVVGGRFGRLDVLVNNAGIGGFDRVDRMEPRVFRDVVETNLLGPYLALHNAAPLMKKNGGGFVVNIASLAGINAFAGGSAYNASKFGLLGFSDAAMLDLRHGGIRVAVVRPGSVAPEFSHVHGNRDTSWMLAPEDVAEAVADLVRFPDRAIPSRIELRPSRPPKK